MEDWRRKEGGGSTSDWNSGDSSGVVRRRKRGGGGGRRYVWRVVRRIGEVGEGGRERNKRHGFTRGVNDLSRVVSWLGFGNVLKRFTTTQQYKLRPR